MLGLELGADEYRHSSSGLGNAIEEYRVGRRDGGIGVNRGSSGRREPGSQVCPGDQVRGAFDGVGFSSL